MILALAILSGLGSSRAQQQHRRKVPVLDKVTSGGSSHQAFSGNVQSLDWDHAVLNVNTVQGGNTEIFPLKRGVRVSAADGKKLKLTVLKPGTSVIVYYDQKGDHRAVREIVVLASGPAEANKKTSPPS